MIEILTDAVWQMSSGERAAVEGVLRQLAPRLAIEIGTAEGAELRRIAEHAETVHAFDLQAPSLGVPANAVMHVGDSHRLLPELLDELAGAGENVDFVMVDGDHSAAGVRRDIEDLLNSPAVARTIILVHDVTNEEVRRGVDAVHFGAWPKVAHVDLDWIPGQLFREPSLLHELWSGLGLVRVDTARHAYGNGSIHQQRYYPAASLLAEARDMVVERESHDSSEGYGELLDELIRVRAELADVRGDVDRRMALGPTELHDELEQTRALLARCRGVVEDLKGSASWRLTAPLRAAKSVVAGRRRS